MQLDVGESQGRHPIWLTWFPKVTQEVGHGGRLELLGRAEREAADGAELLLELAGAAGIERQMSRIVRTRCQLVDEQAAVPCKKELDAQKADVLERFEDPMHDVHGLCRDRRRHIGRRHRQVENMTM